MGAFSVLIRSHWRLICFILGLVLIFWFLWALRSVFLPFIVGLLLAYMVLPVIRWVEKRLPGAGRWPKFKRVKRVSIIVVIYLLSMAVFGLIIFYLITVIGKALVSIADDAPQLIPNGLDAIADWVKSISFFSSGSMQLQIDKYSAQAGVALGNALQSFLTQGVGILQSSSGMILGFVSMPVFLFFILKDWDNLRVSFRDVLPSWALTHAKSVLSIIQNVTIRYLRGQMILGFAVGLLAFILLTILGIDFALPLAALAAVTELVPMIGPWIGGIAGVLVTLAVAPEKVIWVAFGYFAIQLLENNLLVPKIQGTQMNINPAFIIVLSILGAHFAGILGFIIALPLSMTIVEIVKYLRNSAREGKIS